MLLIVMGVLAAMLLGPSQTLAQTRKPSCTTSSARTGGRHTSRKCTQSPRKTGGKTQARHAAKRHSKHATAGKTHKRAPSAPAPAAKCEDASAPVRAGDGSFSCADGSEPACEDGATPTPSGNGKSLVCPISNESEPSSVEAECEEASALDCGGASGPGEQACENSAGAGASSVCEGEGEGEEG